MPQPSPTGPDRDDLPGEPFGGAGPGVGGGRKWGALGLLIALAAAYCIYEAGVVGGRNDQSPLPLTASAGPAVTAANPKVFVTGRVKRPGVYTLSQDARVQDAIDRAGGVLPGADTDALNLAAWVVDGSKIIVPAKGSPHTQGADAHRGPAVTNGPDTLLPLIPQPLSEPEEQALPTKKHRRRTRTVNPGIVSNTDLGNGVRMASGTSGPGSPPAATVPRTTTPSARSAAVTGAPKTKRTSKPKKAAAPVEAVDLNRGTPEQLETLPGVGPKMAAKIVAYRASNGPFRSVDDLDQVAGIGPKKLEKMRPFLSVK